jgi:RsiW-degrading membrane proteinase PrsW (M82 family)
LSTYNTRLITPPKETEDIYPYRRVWRSLIIETGVVIAVVSILVILIELFRVELPTQLINPINYGLAILPFILWFFFSYRAEQVVQQPRPRIMFTFLVTALIATAIGIPVLDTFYEPERWLSTESTFTRILGYTITIGAMQELLKYLILRFTVWETYETRLDAIAYGTTAAVAYATVLNIQYILNNPAIPSAMGIRVLAFLVLNLIGSLIVSYGLFETLKKTRSLLTLPIAFALATLMNGIGITLRSGIMNASLGISVTATRPLFSLGFLIAFWGVMAFLMLFAFSSSERQEKIAQQTRELLQVEDE